METTPKKLWANIFTMFDVSLDDFRKISIHRILSLLFLFPRFFPLGEKLSTETNGAHDAKLLN